MRGAGKGKGEQGAGVGREQVDQGTRRQGGRTVRGGGEQRKAAKEQPLM